MKKIVFFILMLAAGTFTSHADQRSVYATVGVTQTQSFYAPSSTYCFLAVTGSSAATAHITAPNGMLNQTGYGYRAGNFAAGNYFMVATVNVWEPDATAYAVVNW